MRRRGCDHLRPLGAQWRVRDRGLERDHAAAKRAHSAEGEKCGIRVEAANRGRRRRPRPPRPARRGACGVRRRSFVTRRRRTTTRRHASRGRHGGGRRLRCWRDRPVVCGYGCARWLGRRAANLIRRRRPRPTSFARRGARGVRRRSFVTRRRRTTTRSARRGARGVCRVSFVTRRRRATTRRHASRGRHSGGRRVRCWRDRRVVCGCGCAPLLSTPGLSKHAVPPPFSRYITHTYI